MNKKSNLDGMQEQKLLKIEHNGCWIAFWGLVIAMTVQMILGENSMKQIIGESCVLMIMSLYIVIACIKSGIWARNLKANKKTNFAASLVAGTVLGLIIFATSYMNYHKLVGSIAAFACTMVFTTILCFIALTLSAVLYKKQKHKIEDEPEDDEA